MSSPSPFDFATQGVTPENAKVGQKVIHHNELALYLGYTRRQPSKDTLLKFLMFNEHSRTPFLFKLPDGSCYLFRQVLRSTWEKKPLDSASVSQISFPPKDTVKKLFANGTDETILPLCQAINYYSLSLSIVHCSKDPSLKELKAQAKTSGGKPIVYKVDGNSGNVSYYVYKENFSVEVEIIPFSEENVRSVGLRFPEKMSSTNLVHYSEEYHSLFKALGHHFQDVGEVSYVEEDKFVVHWRFPNETQRWYRAKGLPSSSPLFLDPLSYQPTQKSQALLTKIESLLSSKKLTATEANSPGVLAMRDHLEWCRLEVDQKLATLKEIALKHLAIKDEGRLFCHYVANEGPTLLDFLVAHIDARPESPTVNPALVIGTFLYPKPPIGKEQLSSGSVLAPAV
jgi:hypothetical protein